MIEPKDLNIILATDCGSTTTKAILIEKKGEEYRQTYRGESPTTVESPFEDVTRGALNSFTELEELSGRKILDGEKIIMPARGDEGVDVYVSTSSAGGGLQMMVAGAVRSMSAESAQRAALGAGAIVTDVIASNDKRLPHERIELIRQHRPDMILLSGGTDGGTVSHVVELAEHIAAANPRARLGTTFKLPVLYAGNKDARDTIRKVLEERTYLQITENLRPSLEAENLMPARQKIQDLFLEHVMAHAPGYKKLMTWTSTPIMPTPAAVGVIIENEARRHGISIVGVDIGGATTDVFSVFDGNFTRTVSANLGLSYSISNVLAETGAENVLRWIPFNMGEADLRNRVKNKMIRPTTIPQLQGELQMEQAIAREALRLAFEQHKALAVGLKGVQRVRDISETFKEVKEEGLVNMLKLDLLIGSGGVLSHAPRRPQAMLMLIDAFLPEGITRLGVDSIFMMPHLGVLSSIQPAAAQEVFEKDCLVPLGTCLAITNTGRWGEKCLEIKLNYTDGRKTEDSIPFGELRLYPLGPKEEAELEAHPARSFDLGKGKGHALKSRVTGGVVGLVVDTRGRPLNIPKNNRIELLKKWANALGAYPNS
ncbi:MAG: methylaspartate mutase [Planctomycetes bacterium RIFCSPHIGHO2_12_FULL_52_36]|nr:MAG: methylaspartate mutase [Planctomycetes bacterium RIFCSPHIGHO2_12_FULL_52_36]